ncbi:MAG: NTP transferase domain-containing protein [Opitutales bacterium]|nr:NTP transferase domain-containing protein [Opitutales bacterium]
MMHPFRLATIILAAGQSTRMGSINKLLMRIEGRPMIQRVVDAAIEAASTDIYVVTGFERERIESCLCV